MSLQRILLATALAGMMVLAVPLGSAQAKMNVEGVQNPYQSTPTTLYMHIDGIQDFPINTQPPDDRYLKGQQYGLNTNSFSCLGPVQGAGIVTNSYHTYYGYSTPGYVEYDFEEKGGPRYHKERGLSFDVELDSNAPAKVYWYLETQAAAADSDQLVDPNTAPLLLPNVVVRATIRTGDQVGVGDAAFNEGTIIAQGQTEPAHLSPATTADHEQVTHSEVEGKNVYEFAIPLDMESDRIPRDESYNIRVDVFMDNPVCNDPQHSQDDRYIMPNNIRVHTSQHHRPRIDLSVMNPIRIEYLHPQFIGDELVIHTSLNSPWGNYDVGETEGPYATPGGIELSIEGPSPATSLDRAAFVQRHHEHDHHQEAVDVTYIWPYKKDNAAHGVYTIDMSVKNDQETAEATGKVQFQIGKGDLPACDPDVPVKDQVNCVFANQNEATNKDSPGVGLLALVGLLGAIAVALRRRF